MKLREIKSTSARVLTTATMYTISCVSLSRLSCIRRRHHRHRPSHERTFTLFSFAFPFIANEFVIVYCVIRNYSQVIQFDGA